MSATINWRVGTMECYPTYEQNTDVVFTVHWDCVGSETVNNKYIWNIEGKLIGQSILYANSYLYNPFI